MVYVVCIKYHDVVVYSLKWGRERNPWEEVLRSKPLEDNSGTGRLLWWCASSGHKSSKTLMLRHLAKGSFGPNGTCAVLRANQFSGASLVSAVGGRILADNDDLLTSDPVGLVVLKNNASAQHEHQGDGSLTAAFIACSLIQRTTERGPLSPATRALTVATFQRCLEWCAEHMRLPSTQGSPASPTLGMPLRVSHLPSMLALLRSVLSPKSLAAPDADAVDTIAVQLLQAFILVCPEENARVVDSLSADFASGVRIHKVVGAPHEQSRCVEGVIIDTPVPLGPSDEQQLEYDSGGRVLVFTASLDVELDNRRRVVTFEHTVWVPRAEQERRLAATIIGACRRLEIKVVISQRVINRHLQEQLVKAGILPLERVSIRHVDALARLTGAQPLGTWRHESDPIPGCNDRAGPCGSEWAKSFGVCGAINTVHLGGQRFTLIRPPSPVTFAESCEVAEKEVAEKHAPRSVATLVLCAPTEPEMKELDAVVKAATMVGWTSCFDNKNSSSLRATSSRFRRFACLFFSPHERGGVGSEPYERVLASSFNRPEVVAGGGCTESLLAGCVRARARALAGVADMKDDQKYASVQREFHSHTNSEHVTRGETVVDWEAVEIFASTLEELASATAPPDVRMELFTAEYLANANTGMLLGGLGAGLLTREALDTARGFQFFGWENDAGDIVSVASGDVVGDSFTISGARVLDFLPAKLESLRLAVETACVALRIENTARDN